MVISIITLNPFDLEAIGLNPPHENIIELLAEEVFTYLMEKHIAEERSKKLLKKMAHKENLVVFIIKGLSKERNP